MDEIEDEISDKTGNYKTGEELSELAKESDELNGIDDHPSERFCETDEFDDIIPERFSETDEFDDIIPERFSEIDEFDDIIPERFCETDEFDDIIPERFSEIDEFDDIIPERFCETDEFDDIIPERFCETDEFDDIIPERFSEIDEFDDIIPERFIEPDEFDDGILDDAIHDKEDSERADEDQDSGDVGNIIENEKIVSQSTSTVLTNEIEEIESNMEHQEQEEEIEFRKEECQEDTEPIVNTDESEFIKDVEELAEHARETKGEDESVEPQAEKENAAYYAEQYYEKLKEKEVVNDQDSEEEQETEELRQETEEELKGDQKSGYKNDEDKKDILEENELGSTGESNNSQETDEGGDTNNNSDSSSDSSEQGNESYENLSSESSSTVLVSENKEEMQEDQDELEKTIEKELEEGVEAINKYLEEEAEFINAYQEMVGKAREFDEERESEGEERQKTDEEWEKEVETAAYTAEQLYESMKEIETNTNNEEISEIKEELEIAKEVEQSVEISEPQLSDIKEEVCKQEQKLEQKIEERKEFEQRQTESAIQEELETEAKPIVNEKEIEKLQEMDVEEQFQTVHLNEYIDELVEKQEEEIKQLKEQVEKEELEAQASKIKKANLELYEEVDKVRYVLSQHEVEATIEEELETEPESIINEKEKEQLQELDVEEQFETVHFNEYVDELVEKQNEEAEKLKEQEEHEELEAQASKIRKANLELYEEVYKERYELSQYEVEATIEEELETEPEPIVNEKEKEQLQELDVEEQFETVHFNEYMDELVEKQEEDKNIENDKIEQEKENIEQAQEIITSETIVENNSQEGELEQETTSSDEEVVEQLEIEENKDQQQELDEIEREQEDLDKTIEKNYDKVKKLYKQQTGKRPIYANKETKGFKQWLEQKKKSEEKEKTKQKKELKEEQKKEEGWKTLLKRWIREASEEECNAELKSELKKALESYNEFEYLTRKFLELYKKSQHEKLTEIEKNRLKSLTERLQGLGPIQLELLDNIRAFKDYFNNHFWELMNRFFANRVRGKFFKHISQKYKELRKEQKAKEKLEEILKNWIEQASEGEISLELKVLLKEIVENYSELEELAIRFMELYKKEQFEQISQSEKVELKSLIKTLEKLGPINIVLFANIRAIKCYLNDQHLSDFSVKKRINRVISKFFKHISQEYKELRKEQKSGQEKKIQNEEEGWQKILRKWISDASEKGLLSSELKSLLENVLEKYQYYEEYDDIILKYIELSEKFKKGGLNEKEKHLYSIIMEKLDAETKINLNLYFNVSGFKAFFQENYWKNPILIEEIKAKFLKHLLKKYKELRKEQKSEQEEEYEQVKQMYSRKTGRRPIYKGEQTKDFSQWLEEQNELQTKKIENSGIYNFINIETDSFQNDNETFMVQKQNLNKKELEIVDELNKYESNPEIEKNDELEKLKQTYKEETGKKPIYAGKKTKSFIKWLESLTIESEGKKEKETEMQNEDEFKAIIEKYKYTGSWKIVSEDYAHYSRETLYRRIRAFLGEEAYSNLIKQYSQQNKTFQQKERVTIPNDVLGEIIRIFKSKEFKSWKVISLLYPEYSEKVIRSRAMEKLGINIYNNIIRKKSSKIRILKTVLNEMIAKYKEVGSWNKVSEIYNDYKMDTIVSRVKDYIGQPEYNKLKKKYSYNKEKNLKKINIPEEILKDIIEKFKNLHSWVKVSNCYLEFPVHIIRNRVKEYLGGKGYRDLVKEYRKGLTTRTKDIFIPIETLHAKIEDYKLKGIWKNVNIDEDQFSLRVLIRQIKELIGLENYKALIDQYSIKDNSNLIHNKKIVIPIPILNQIIIQYKNLNSWTRVSTKFPDYSKKIISDRVKEHIGLEEYRKLIELYSKRYIPSRKIDISENQLKEFIKEYSKHQSWTKVAENYSLSRSYIRKKIKEYLGENNYNELIKREVNETQYTQLFYNEKYRVENALSQIIQIIGKKVAHPQLDNLFEDWEDIFYFLKENPLFKFTDILTGEIIEEKCLIDLHHIDGDKSNDKMNNLVYLLHENHTIVSIAQLNWKFLREFFEDLLKSNLESISKGIIPRSWILGWRSLAIEHGINLPEKSYQRHGLIFRNITGKESKVLQLINFKGRSTNGKIAIIDVEHTGGNPNQGKIVEIGIVELDINSGEITPIFNSLIREKGFLLKKFSKNYSMNHLSYISPKLIISLGEKFTLEYNKQIIQNILQSYKKVFYWDCTNHTEYKWMKTRGFEVSNFYDFQNYVKSYLKSKNINKFNFQNVWNYFYNDEETNASKYLCESEYYQNHRAYDDAEHEAMLLYFLIKDLGFSLD